MTSSDRDAAVGQPTPPSIGAYRPPDNRPLFSAFDPRARTPKHPPTVPTAVPTRLPGLDGLRGIAVSLVVLYHFHIYAATFAPADPHWLLPVVKLFNLGSSMGWIGVEMFFVLSGFLITGILDDAKERQGRLRAFYLRRALRILPLYYAVLLLHLVVLRHVTLPPLANLRFVVSHQAWYWSFLTNFLFTEPGSWNRLTSHMWTLAIEEQFYLVWPLIVWWLERERAVRVCLLMICAAPILRLLLQLGGAPPQDSYLWTPTEVDSLAMGAFLAFALRGSQTANAVLRHGRALAVGAVVGLVGLIVWRHQFAFTDPPVPLVGFSCLAIVSGMLTLKGAGSPMPRGPFSAIVGAPLLRFLGKYSYAIYLLHMPIIQLWAAPQRAEVRLVSDGVPPFAAHLLYIAVVTAGIIAAALASWLLIESPFLRLRPR